jgi:2-oxoglutarate dehydrogenase E2 component (dihydrolipoamide succinyltransferase)
MAYELTVPTVGESITEVEIGAWLKQPGEFVERDEAIVEIESDKATVEVYAPVAGTVTEILIQTGEVAQVGDLIGRMEAGEASGEQAAAKKEEAPAANENAVPEAATAVAAVSAANDTPKVMPSAQHAMAASGLTADKVEATGPGDRILKEDVLRAAGSSSPPASPPATPKAPPSPVPVSANGHGPREEEAVRMTPMRRKIAEHLVNAQQNSALLTTFNEVDMSPVMNLRAEYKDVFEKKYGVRLGFMSFFVKASIDALKLYPQVNAEISGTDIIYKNYQDIGIAVGGPKGLLVPVLRNAERMSFSDIEMKINDLGKRAQVNKIGLDELQGGTFTISNGGIYGSMMSTPIVNPPQSAILGMHSIQKRAVVVNDEIVIRPMMYLALTYDHRIIDGKEAVTFLVRIKECIENPTRILLEI